MTHFTSLRVAFVMFSLGLSACSAQQADDEQDFGPDAGTVVRPDAPAQTTLPPDAAPVDAAPVVPDAACVPQVTQLLLNPAFDMAPRATGWTERLASTSFPLVTTEDGVAEHTPTAKVWLGGLVATSGTINDAIYQDIVIPAKTTNLVLTGFHDVRTGEQPSTVAFDTAKIVVTDLNNVVLAPVLQLSNLSASTAWTAFGHAFTQDLSGKTVRIRISSSNDELDATSFFFDSLALTATAGCAPIQ